MPLHEPDYEVDGFEPADDEHEQHHDHLDVSSFKVLGEHRTDTDSYFVLLDEGATWGIPGSPQLRAVHISRDLSARTFEVDSKELPLYVMAQSYLTARGCPSDGLSPQEGVHDPADDLTRALEARVRSDGDHFALLASYTADMREPVETVVMLRSLDPQAVPEFRILREGGFETYEAAVNWWEAWSDEEARTRWSRRGNEVGKPSPLSSPPPRRPAGDPPVPAPAWS
ncbi:hypothetical protein [Streptomyces sp. WAC06614]|uniref:hypothetical protein n=1 Tax=Streptomyces sp. WAC06614 TaxID=2487416 RepID=UPI000F768C8C|nr:hypothetical protein [Streptomyces sp. WAC06614]RSS75531.1 hypothetical protein EF918_24070 [Streptomyces sp. WAC06614]